MNRSLILGCSLALIVGLLPLEAATNKMKFSEIAPLLQSGQPSAKALAARAAGRPVAASEHPRFTQTPEGYLDSLGAAPDTEFPAPGGPAGQPEVTAKNFLRQHGRLFGVTSRAVDFKLRKKNTGQGRHSIRLTQTYANIPVFGGELVVQVNDDGGIEHVSGNITRETDELDQGTLQTRPKLTADEAMATARTLFAPRAPGQDLSVTPPELTIYAPALLKVNGPKRLTWQMEVWSADQHTVGKRVFVDAHSGELAQAISLVMEVQHRSIYDHENNSSSSGILRRSEGQVFAGGAQNAYPDTNYAYDFLGDAYLFFQQHFGRDGILGTNGTVEARVRYCVANKPCPWANASSGGTVMYFGDDYILDDVVAHEYTHGVINYESALNYLNESGAINESLADVFGEFVDLSNTAGNDDSTNRWNVGEDLNTLTRHGPIRSMSFPSRFGDPSWRGDSNYVPPVETGTEANDNGGVHSNSGVNNKLCYLLTDGERFREITVTGMGISRVAALYYEANANLLVSSSDWDHLAVALRQAAINLGWTEAERMNVDNGILAVGIGTPLPMRYVDENMFTLCVRTGDALCLPLVTGAPYDDLLTALGSTGGSKTLMLRGAAKQTRISGTGTIRSWDGPARIQRP